MTDAGPLPLIAGSDNEVSTVEVPAVDSPVSDDEGGSQPQHTTTSARPDDEDDLTEADSDSAYRCFYTTPSGRLYTMFHGKGFSKRLSAQTNA